MKGGHCLKTWSKTQAIVAKSSAESELYGVVRGTVEGIGMLTMAFYIKQVDDAYNRTLTKFQKVHNNTDYR